MQALISHKACKNRKHSIESKLAAIKEAKQKGNHAVGRILVIDERRIQEWCSKEAELHAIATPSKHFRLDGGGRHVTSEVLEARLVTFVKDLRAKKLCVTAKMIYWEGKRLAVTMWWRSNTGRGIQSKLRFHSEIQWAKQLRHLLLDYCGTETASRLHSGNHQLCHICPLHFQKKFNNCGIISCEETSLVWRCQLYNHH